MRKISLILALILIAATLGCVQTDIAFAASETVYTGVLEDLQKDETFDVSKYPSKDKLSDKDKVMDVIQIAESNAGELFLYVYQPQAGKFIASEVRISTSIDENLAPEDKKLTLLDRNGALEKYKVEHLQLKSDAVRYYLILQLARPWDKQLDNGNVADTVPYPIEKLYTAKTSDIGITYTEEHVEVRLVTDKYVGNLRYYDSGIGAEKYTSSHYVAFSTDIHMDKLFEADVSYVRKDYSLVEELAFNSGRYKDNGLYLRNTSTASVTLYSDQYSGNDAKWSIFSHTWTDIQSIDQFLSSETLEASVKDSLKNKQWVLRFAKTDFEITKMGLAGNTYKFSDTSEVTVFRLKYMTNGKVYNLGVIDNKQTGSGVNNSDNDQGQVTIDKLQALWDSITDFFKRAGEFFAKYWWVILIIVGVIALGILAAFIKPVAKVLWWILKIIFYIVTLPVWLIIWGVRAIKKKKEK